MEEKKRRTATKKAIAAYLEQSPQFTPEYISSLIEKAYPGEYAEHGEIGMEVVKELYRRSNPLDEGSFAALLAEMVQNGKMGGYTMQAKREHEIAVEIDELLDAIFRDAKKGTVYLSDYPQWADPGVKEHFMDYVTPDRSLAQVFYSRLNNLALEETGTERWTNMLPFRCYTEPNGDVVFTKNKRDLSFYDEAGNPKYSEKEIERMNGNPPSGGGVNYWPLLIGLLMVLIVALLFIFG